MSDWLAALLLVIAGVIVGDVIVILTLIGGMSLRERYLQKNTSIEEEEEPEVL